MVEPRILEVESGDKFAWVEVDGSDVSVTLWEGGPTSALTCVFPDDEGLNKEYVAPFVEHFMSEIPKNKEWNSQVDWVFEYSKNKDFYKGCFKSPEILI